MKNILVIGHLDRIKEFKQLSLSNAKIDYLDQIEVISAIQMLQLDEDEDEMGFFDAPLPEDIFGDYNIEDYDAVIDLNLDENPENFYWYMEHSDLCVIGCAVKQTLSQIAFEYDKDEIVCKLFGMNALPTFINRPLMECSVYQAEDRPVLEKLLQELGMDFEIVEDRIGMVTPRIVCMIINEACFTLGEGTASIPDVDRAMKLGTNYPKGPFEWADQIGIYNVFQVLETVRQETGEEKYKVAPALKHQFRHQKGFYEDLV